MRKISSDIRGTDSDCNCPFCQDEAEERKKRQSESNKKSQQVRKFKSSENITANSQKRGVSVFAKNKQDSLKKHSHTVEVIYERNKNVSNPTVYAHSKHSFSNPIKEKNFYGIWRKCHDSNSRMPWSMANSYADNSEFQLENQVYNEGVDQRRFDSRVFPFKPTPSGNLKVVPQQVVFESKKVSVLVADPRHTRVNVTSALEKQQELLPFQPVLREKDNTKLMDTKDAGNAEKNRILSALTLMGGEGRGSPLNQILPGMPSNGQNKLKISSPLNDVLNTLLHENPEEREPEDLHSIESDDSPKPELNLIKLGFSSSTPIDWNTIKLPQKTNLYKHMHYRITNYVNPDCLVQIEDVQFNCHLLVLQCYSAYFNEKTSRDVVKLPAENVSPKAFELIYEWMTYVHGDSYTILKRDNILEVFLAAQYLGIKELEEQCWAFVDCEDLFSEDTAFILYLEAKKCGISAIMELMIPRIMKFFLTLVSSRDFLDLQLDEVYVLLSSNYISVHSEIEVFMSAVRWLWHDWKERKECLEQVMSCVRFGLIAPWQLVDIRRNPENPEFLEITSHPSVQQMIDNGLAYAIIKYWYGNQTGDYYHWIDLLGLSEPPSRNWAGEEKNYVTYREFLHDLEHYRKELCVEKEKNRMKKENLPSKPKRNSAEQPTGLTTSPRDTLPTQQQNDKRFSRKHASAASGKPARADCSLGDARSEIVRGYVNEESDFLNSGFRAFKQPPPTIWNLNTIMRESEINSNLEEIASSKVWSSKIGHGMGEPNCQNYLGTFHETRMPSAQCVSPGGAQSVQLTSGSVTLKVPVMKNFRRAISGTLSSNIKEELLSCQAAITIQQAYRKYKCRQRRRVFQERKSLTPSPSSSKESCGTSSQLSDKITSAPCNFKRLVPKDYLKEGSLFFAEREAIIVFGGIDPHSKYGDGRNNGRNIFRYHSELNQWDLVGELPQPRHHHAVAFLKGKVYLAGGTDPRDDERGKTIVVGTVWSFDPISRAWFKETNMLTPRKNFGLAVMKGKLLAIGGQDKYGRILSSVERYDPVNKTWEYLANLNTERTGAAAIKFNDTVWVAGGMTTSKKAPLTSSVESYNPKYNSWTEQAPLRFPRCFGCLLAMNNTLYFIGGAGRASEKERTTSSCNAIDLWNPKENEWKLHFAMSIPRHGHAVAYLGTQILIIGGVTTAYIRALTDVECFCCERKTWVRGLSGLPVPLSGHGAVTLPPASLM